MCGDAYNHVRNYLEHSTVVKDYRRSPQRPSSVGLEVRKDLVCSFDEQTGLPLPTTPEQRKVARQVAQAIAGSIRTYFETDREVYETMAPGVELPAE